MLFYNIALLHMNLFHTLRTKNLNLIPWEVLFVMTISGFKF